MPYYPYSQFMDEIFPFKIQIKNNEVLNNAVPHSHEYFQICYVTKGTCLHNVNGKKATLIKGDLFSIPPNFEHYIEVIPNKHTEIVHIDFMPFLLDHSLHGLTDMDSFIDFAFIQPFVALNDRLLPKLNLSHQVQMETERLIGEMIQELNDHKEGYTLIIKSNLQKLLVIAGREYASYLENNTENKHLQANRRHFEKALEFIELNYMTELKLQDAAAQAAMSPTYFSTMFKLLKGRSFVEYVNDIRLEASMKLLKQTSESVEEISYRCGFNHLSHFHRTFKKTTGLTPGEYRKMSLQS
jgi:AraC-like DNA-binding protein